MESLKILERNNDVILLFDKSENVIRERLVGFSELIIGFDEVNFIVSSGTTEN